MTMTYNRPSGDIQIFNYRVPYYLDRYQDAHTITSTLLVRSLSLSLSGKGDKRRAYLIYWKR